MLFSLFTSFLFSSSFFFFFFFSFLMMYVHEKLYTATKDEQSMNDVQQTIQKKFIQRKLDDSDKKK
jgi:hypothetical protein